MAWNKIIVDVDYQPMDPGVRHTFCERTEVKRSELKPGDRIAYKDPSGLLPGIRVKALDEDSITLVTTGGEFRLWDEKGHRNAKLAEAGRDYTNFELRVQLVTPVSVTRDASFLSRFYRDRAVAALTGEDMTEICQSDDAYAKFAYGRWLYVKNLDSDAYDRAYTLLTEASEGGCADALTALSLMWANGTAGLADPEEAKALMEEAREKGSAFAAWCDNNPQPVNHNCSSAIDDAEYEAMCESQRRSLTASIGEKLSRQAELCDGHSAFELAWLYYYGKTGFPRDPESAMKWADVGFRLRDPDACSLIVTIQEECGDSLPEELRLSEGEIAFMRLEALRYGDSGQREAVIQAYRAGLYGKSLNTEIETVWLPS